MKILIAEDDSIARHIVISSLRKWSYEPVEATNGEEALSLLEKRDGPEIAIMDWMMPKMTGMEVLKRLRKDMPERFFYILFLTSRASSKDILATLEEGANDFMPKPLDLNQLKVRLQKACKFIELQKRLMQGQKLGAISQLAAGLMQELKSPAEQLASMLKRMQNTVQAAVQQLDMGAAPSTLAVLSQDLENIIPSLSTACHHANTIKRHIDAVEDFQWTGSQSRIPVSINECVENALLITHFHLKPVATIETHLAAGIPLLPGYAARITQAIMNILMNAADAILEKEGRSKGCISIQTDQKDNIIRCLISDNGKGISEPDKEKIFDPFFSTKDNQPGTGRGLALVRNIIVDQHQGQVSFESTPEKGSTFHLSFPLKPGSISRTF